MVVIVEAGVELYAIDKCEAVIEEAAKLDSVPPLSNARRSRRNVVKIGIGWHPWNSVVHLEVLPADSECSEVPLVSVTEASLTTAPVPGSV